MTERVKYSKNFYRDEFACKCGCGYDEMDPKTIEGLERLREALGSRRVYVNSGCRCPKHNKAVGGSATSQHLTVDKEGKPREVTAADIVVDGRTPEEVAHAAETIPEFQSGGIGRYNTFTHVDTRPSGPARWDHRTGGGRG